MNITDKVPKDFIFDLQMFADSTDPAEPAESTDTGDPADQTDNQIEKKFTQADLDKIIGRKLTSARAKWEKEKEEEKKEAARLAALSEQERLAEEARIREEKLKEREAKLKLAEDKMECENELKERNLDVSFANFLLGPTPDITLSNIKAFEEAFKKAVAEGINEKIKGTTPSGKLNPSVSGDGVIAKDEFFKLPIHEQARLYKENPDVYRTYYNI